MEKNRDVYLNFGLIAYASLRDIEDLQRLINEHFKGKIVYQTVTAKRLFLSRKSESDKSMNVRKLKNGKKEKE